MTEINVTERTDVAEQAVLDLSPAFWGKPRISAFVYAFGVQLQELETAIFEVIDGRLLTNAVGVQLATLGRLVGEPRYGRTDDEYRIAIRGRILVNRSVGRFSDLLKILELMRPGETYSWFEDTAEVEFESESTEHDFDREALAFLQLARAAGVRLQMTAPYDDEDEFSTAADWTATGLVADATHGFGDSTTATTGGKLRFVL